MNRGSIVVFAFAIRSKRARTRGSWCGGHAPPRAPLPRSSDETRCWIARGRGRGACRGRERGRRSPPRHRARGRRRRRRRRERDADVLQAVLIRRRSRARHALVRMRFGARRPLALRAARPARAVVALPIARDRADAPQHVEDRRARPRELWPARQRGERGAVGTGARDAPLAPSSAATDINPCRARKYLRDGATLKAGRAHTSRGRQRVEAARRPRARAPFSSPRTHASRPAPRVAAGGGGGGDDVRARAERAVDAPDTRRARARRARGRAAASSARSCASAAGGAPSHARERAQRAVVRRAPVLRGVPVEQPAQQPGLLPKLGAHGRHGVHLQGQAQGLS